MGVELLQRISIPKINCWAKTFGLVKVVVVVCVCVCVCVRERERERESCIYMHPYHSFSLDS